MIAQALGAGGKDNITVVIADVLEAEPEWGQSSTGDETVDNDVTVNSAGDADSQPMEKQQLADATRVEEQHA